MPHYSNKNNILAWDKLYGSTKKSLWGEAASIIKKFFPSVEAHLDSKSLILDAATGEGRNLGLLHELPGKVFACDASNHAINKIPLQFQEFTEVCNCSLTELKFPENHFKFVLLWDTVETLPDLDDVFKELSRVIEKDGFLLCNIPDEQDGVANIDMKPLDDGTYLYQEKYFYRFMSQNSAEVLFEKHGYQIEKIERCAWMEDPHPEFRTEEHQHESLVYLTRKI